MSWERVANLVVRRPGRVLAACLAVLLPPLAALPAMETTFDELDRLPADADSVRGFRALEGSFEPGAVQPVIVVVESRRTIWEDESFRAIDHLTLSLGKVPGVADVQSVTRPLRGGPDPGRLRDAGLGDLAGVAERLPRATRGLGRAIRGLERIREGLDEIAEGVPGRRAGLEEALEGVRAMREGLGRLDAGLGNVEEGLGEAIGGLRRLADEVADPTLEALRRAWRDLRDTTVARSDPEYPDLVRNVGEALARVSGRCPDATGIGPQPEDCPAGRRVAEGYDGLGPALREVAGGLERARAGIGRIRGGLGEIDDGLARLAGGLEESRPRLDRLASGTRRMVGGLDRIIPGLTRLRRGLAAGGAVLEETGLLPEPSGEMALTASLVDAVPKLKRQLRPLVAGGGTATRLLVTMDGASYEDRSMEGSRRMREVARLSLRETPLEDAAVHVAGSAPFFADVARATGRDFRTVLWAVILGVFLVLALLLRSLVAPFYLILTVLLSFAATLGLTVVVFQLVLGESGLVWWLPIFLFVVLVALGADYNIFLTSRVREEAAHTDTRTAVARGLAATGHVITSAGLILAGTFGALLVSSLEGLVQMGFAASVGILIDTFVVRSLLVPSIAVLAGSASWWPSGRARRP